MSVKLASFYCVPKYTFFNWGFNARTMDPESSSNDEYVKFFDLLGEKQTVSISLQIGKKKYPASISLSRPSAGKPKNQGNGKLTTGLDSLGTVNTQPKKHCVNCSSIHM